MISSDRVKETKELYLCTSTNVESDDTIRHVSSVKKEINKVVTYSSDRVKETKELRSRKANSIHIKKS